MAVESPDTSPALRGRAAREGDTTRSVELPHLDRLVQTAADKILAVWREGHRVHTILVAVGSFKPLQEIALVEIPDPNAFIERARSDVLGVWRDGYRRHAILYRQRQNVVALLNVPKTDGAVTAAGCDGTAVTREIERVDILLVAREGVADLPLMNVPNLQIPLVTPPQAQIW